MDITEFEIPLFSPNVTEINFGIFDLWLMGYDEKEVLYLLQKSFYSDFIKRKNSEIIEGNEEKNFKAGISRGTSGNTNNDEKGKIVRDKSKDNKFFVKNRIMNIFNIDNKDTDYHGEKLQINDLILSKEYINISKNIYTTYKSNKNLDALKSKLCAIADINNSLKSRVLVRLKCILNLLCCFRNSYEITKFLLIFYELQKNEPLINEKTFIKQNIGNNNFVNRIMCFIKEAENYSKIKKAEFEKQKGNEKPKNF
ncbi:conserved Plasmodium protein, unknown function [Plasmodium ovale wallikeri]|uniref:Uncharacterized protein n=1 Tax=Plasmodium ovale wallikeri TaxID=864142 RepID=A0A1A8ZIS0_PLAOA|nr:conserved Plasmodium protein, unknown function [Plasmodium ovale wallikeri]SBT43945.1 conserved Plasmodium protein, unknown function [Plasmodium ovale wallikeri]